MGNKKATGFLCLRLVPCFAYVGAEDNRKGIPFVKIVSLLCKLIQFLMVALSVTVHKALILLVFLNHPYQSLAFIGLSGVPGAARTRGLSLRRRTLYPTELRRLVIQLLPESECTYIHLGGERSILLSYGEIYNGYIICSEGIFVK